MPTTTLIDCNTIIVEAIEEVTKTNLDHTPDDIVMLDEFRSEGTTMSINEWDLFRFPEPKA
jgi:hypothetical protein